MNYEAIQNFLSSIFTYTHNHLMFLMSRKLWHINDVCYDPKCVCTHRIPYRVPYLVAITFVCICVISVRCCVPARNAVNAVKKQLKSLEMNGAAGPVYLTEDDVKRLLRWDMLIPVIETALTAVSQTGDAKSVIQPARTIMPVVGRNGLLLTMPGFSKADDALACKLVTSFPNNKEKGMATVLATVLLFDSDTGKVQAIIEGNEITAWRTAAASAVATKYLCSRNDVLAVLGSGIQARSHISALTHSFNFKEIRVWNHRKEGADKLAAEFLKLGRNIIVCSNAKEAVQNADVIVTATYASSPILKGEWVKKGVHINVVGAGINHHSELDTALYQAASIYTDTMPAAQIELKGLADIGVSVLGEIGEIIHGTKNVPRENITVFHSLGMAVEDVVTAKLIFDQHKIKSSL